jgi:hypothetical protein
VKPLHFHPEAKAELDDGIAYFERRREALGLNFLDEVNATTLRIQQLPGAGSAIGDAGFRKRVVERFPYVVVYQEMDDYIWIAAVAHAKRRPGYWKNRVIE